MEQVRSQADRPKVFLKVPVVDLLEGEFVIGNERDTSSKVKQLLLLATLGDLQPCKPSLSSTVCSAHSTAAFSQRAKERGKLDSGT